MTITRRHVLAGAAATAAVAAMPAAIAIAAVEEASFALLDPALLAWEPGRYHTPRALITIAGRWHVVLLDHVAGDVPSERYISRPLVIGDGRFVEEYA